MANELDGPTVDCRGCGLPIDRDEQATSVMVRVWVKQARKYREEGPFHAPCGKRRDMEAKELAGQGSVERIVRAHDPERAAFERFAQACPAGGYSVERDTRPGRDGYWSSHTQLMWDTWQAARPKRAAVGALINIAAELVQRKPIRALDVLSERSGRTLGRRAMDDAIESAHDSLARAAMRIVDAARAL